MGVSAGALEAMVADSLSMWRGRKVFLTGHTGFKGSWLALWLHHLGASVYGYALDPPTTPSLFDLARVGDLLASDTRADVALLDRLTAAMDAARPDIVFHLAAQPLVGYSYMQPRETFATNVMGTAHLLEAVRAVDSVRAVVVVTTDKVYETDGAGRPHSEGDRLGGHDPYSASKAAAEIVAASYRASFFQASARRAANIATARAGNVIGGADWASDRLLPDCVRSFTRGEPVRLRYPEAVRPWQHVLEPLCGYLHLGERLLAAPGERFAAAWNFGPGESGDATVREVAELAARVWGSGARVEIDSTSQHAYETGYLRLDATQARAQLGWLPRWGLEEAVQNTLMWYRDWLAGADALQLCLSQIEQYEKRLA